MDTVRTDPFVGGGVGGDSRRLYFQDDPFLCCTSSSFDTQFPLSELNLTNQYGIGRRHSHLHYTSRPLWYRTDPVHI